MDEWIDGFLVLSSEDDFSLLVLAMNLTGLSPDNLCVTGVLCLSRTHFELLHKIIQNISATSLDTNLGSSFISRGIYFFSED